MTVARTCHQRSTQKVNRNVWHIRFPIKTPSSISPNIMSDPNSEVRIKGTVVPCGMTLILHSSARRANQETTIVFSLTTLGDLNIVARGHVRVSVVKCRIFGENNMILIAN